MAYFTKYICFYRLNEDNILLLNTLTSAIDIVDNNTFNKIENMRKNFKKIIFEENSELYSMLKKEDIFLIHSKTRIIFLIILE